MKKGSRSLWEVSVFHPIYWPSWFAMVPVAWFVSIPIHRRWGETAGLATFFALMLWVLLSAIMLEFDGGRKDDPRWDRLD
jgi:hypothetical protein